MNDIWKILIITILINLSTSNTFGVNSNKIQIEEIQKIIMNNEKLSHIKLQKIEMGMAKYELNITEI